MPGSRNTGPCRGCQKTVVLQRQAHRALWQRLPRSLRREALFRVTSWIAPRPAPVAEAVGPVIVAGVLSTASGLGQWARMSYEALRIAGVPVQAIDLSSELMQPSDFSGFSYVDACDHRGPATLCLHVNGPLVPLALLRLGRSLVRDKRIVAHWAWELPALPGDWAYGWPFVHEIVTPSRFVAEAVRPCCGGIPVHVVPLPVMLNVADREADEPAGLASDQPFTVLCILNVASSLARKNPCGAIAAFKAAFGDDPTARFVLKVSNMEAYADARAILREAIGDAANIEMIEQTLNAHDLAGLYRRAGAVISLHRSEGFGLVPAEAMARGLPVVATAWSGTADFLNVETGIPVPCRLVPAADPQEIYQHRGMVWADPDITVAAAALRRLRAEPGLARRLGQSAATFAADHWSPKTYAATLAGALGLAAGAAS